MFSIWQNQTFFISHFSNLVFCLELFVSNNSNTNSDQYDASNKKQKVATAASSIHQTSLPYFAIALPQDFSQLPKKKKTLILDLDETLVHSTTEKLNDTFDLSVDVQLDDYQTRLWVSKRPFLDHFLETVSQWYTLVIFTASMQQYADAVIDLIDPKRLIKRRLFRGVKQKTNTENSK